MPKNEIIRFSVAILHTDIGKGLGQGDYPSGHGIVELSQLIRCHFFSLLLLSSKLPARLVKENQN